MVDSVQPHATITEWTVPTASSGPSALTLDQSGSCCWFLEYYGNELGHFDASTNTFQEWPLPTASSNPYGLAISTSGTPTLWGTEYGSDRVFAFSPASSTFLEYQLPHSNTGVGYISIEPTGPQVRVWFTETIRNLNGELIYDPTGNATLYEDSFPAAVGGGAYGVYAESSSVWYAGFSALVRWDRASQQYTMWPLPVHGSATGRFVALDPYGQPWYTQGVANGTSNDNYVGVLRGNGILQEWRLPSLGADPRKISFNSVTQQPWIVERSLTAGNGAIAVLSNSTDGGLVTAVPTTAPSGGTPIVIAPTSTAVTSSSHAVVPVVKEVDGLPSKLFTEYSVGPSSPQDVVTDAQGNVWVSEPAVNKIARLSAFNPDFALSTVPQSISLLQGTSITISVVGTSISGYQGTPAISPKGLPHDVTFSAAQTQLSIQRGGNASVQMAINVGPNATAGVSSVTFEGNDGTIAHSISVPLSITNSTGGPVGKPQCLIATATYGSNVSPEVELLRNFRDNAIRSKTGASFLILFNSWYYSFSPYVASYISDHSNTREMMKGVLYPLIGSLALSSGLFSILAGYPEPATVLSGLLASCMIGAFYLGLPLGVIKRKLRFTVAMSTRLSAAFLLGGLGGMLVGLSLGTSGLLMIAGSITVLSATCGSALLTADAISRLKFRALKTGRLLHAIHVQNGPQATFRRWLYHAER